MNTVTLHAQDLAGNETARSISFTLDETGDTNPPALNIFWPPDGSSLCGDQFALRATVDDATAKVNVSIVGADQITNIVEGLVERNGLVWVHHLPLTAGENIVTVTATNVAGNSTTTNLMLYRSSVTVTLNPLSSDQYNQSFVTVTGTVSDPAAAVWVNGVEATNDGSGNWEAEGVPVRPMGTAIFEVEINPGGGASPLDSRLFSLADASSSDTGVQSFDVPQRAAIMCSSFLGVDTWNEWGYPGYQLQNWDYANGGSWAVWDTDGGGTAPYGGMFLPSDNPSSGPPWWMTTSVLPAPRNINNSLFTTIMIAPQDQVAAGTKTLYLVGIQAWPVSVFPHNPNAEPHYEDMIIHTNEPLREGLTIQGQTPTVVTEADGSVWHFVHVEVAAGQNVNLYVAAPGNYAFEGKQTNVLKIVDANSGNNVTDQTNAVIVGQQISLFCELTVPVRTGWTFGNFSWTLPGMTFLNYVANDQSGVLYTNIYTNLQSVVFYWADGASNRVIRCSAKVNGQTVTATTTLNVLRPTAKIIATGGTVALDRDTNSNTTLHCGLPVVGSVGILFSNTVAAPPGYSGSINLEWVQKISSLLRRVQTNDFSGSGIWYRRQAADVLDVKYPCQLAFPGSVTSDSPSSQELSPYQAVSYSDSFEMWLMFKPDGGQWVPLRKVSWHWDGAGSKYGTWTLDSHTDPGNPIDTDTTAYPTWTDNINNHPWQKE